MTDDVKADLKKKSKPPTQIAGVTGIDAHKPMGSDPIPRVDWFKLVELPPFQMFVAEQSGLTHGVAMSNWVAARRATLSDSVLYDQYAAWHKAKGLWANETPTGDLIEG